MKEKNIRELGSRDDRTFIKQYKRERDRERERERERERKKLRVIIIYIRYGSPPRKAEYRFRKNFLFSVSRFFFFFVVLFFSFFFADVGRLLVVLVLVLHGSWWRCDELVLVDFVYSTRAWARNASHSHVGLTYSIGFSEYRY